MDPSRELALVYATFPDRETAETLGRRMLEERLAACVTYWEAGSMYRWEGEIEETTETLALFKTPRERVAGLGAALEEAHPYEVACVLPLAVQGPLAAYAAWVGEETS